MMICRISFHLSHFEIDLYVNFKKWWNLKFQTKQYKLLKQILIVPNKRIQTVPKFD